MEYYKIYKLLNNSTVLKFVKRHGLKLMIYQVVIILLTKINDNNTLDTEVVVPLKYLSNLWKFLDLPMVNCEIELDLSWSKECIISEISITPRIPVNPNANPPVQEVVLIQITGAIFQIHFAKLYVLVVILSINDDIKFLENVKQGFIRTISLDKYLSEIATRTGKNN